MEIYVLVLSLATLGGQAYSCCMPQQLEGTVGMSIALSNNGNPLQITAVYDKWAMDTAIGKGYLSGTVYVGGHAIHQEIVQDFNNQVQYEAALGNCTIKPLPFDFGTEGGQICLPSHRYHWGKADDRNRIHGHPKMSDEKLASSKVWSSYHGLGDDTLKVDTYFFTFDAGQFTMTMTTKGCAPVSEGFQTKDGVFNIGVMGLTSGITDPSVFELPSPSDYIECVGKGSIFGKLACYLNREVITYVLGSTRTAVAIRSHMMSKNEKASLYITLYNFSKIKWTNEVPFPFQHVKVYKS